jgi:oxygen-dependent protoporphyrinogen oxidase
MKISIIGAGYSGLTLAYYLNKSGHDVHVLEQCPHPGGLLQSKTTQYGLVESAANGTLMTIELEELLKDLDINFQSARSDSKKRYIFRGNKLRRWPLGFIASLRFVFGILYFLFFKSRCKPKSFETVQSFGTRLFGQHAADYLISPALQGIYAAPSYKLSATLIMGRFFNKKEATPKAKPQVKGLVSFPDGMGGFMKQLAGKLKDRGVVISYEQKIENLPQDHPIVIATSLNQALALAPKELSLFESIPMCNLVSVTNFYHEPSPVLGFGVLYPQGENITALGTLFNDTIFTGRVKHGHSQTWIYQTKESNESVQAQISEDQKRACYKTPSPIDSHHHRWPQAFPLYGIELEKVVSHYNFEQPLKDNLWLTGNYFGHLGLSKILSFNQNLAYKLGSPR